MQSSNLAPAVPGMYPSLAARQIAIRRGEVSMIAGMPAAGKSTLALALAVRANVPTLYLSADTHAHTMALRLIAMLTDTDQSIVEPAMLENREWAASMLEQAAHIQWSFDSSPSAQSLESELQAHAELWSRAPELVVVDNLTDCIVDGGSEHEAQRNFLKDLKYIAREYDTAVLVLHHMSEGVHVERGNCPPRFAIQNKVSQTPALVLSIIQDENGFLGVCPVKNRYGSSSPGGNDVTWLRYNPAAMHIGEVGSEFING